MAFVFRRFFEIRNLLGRISDESIILIGCWLQTLKEPLLPPAFADIVIVFVNEA